MESSFAIFSKWYSKGPEIDNVDKILSDIQRDVPTFLKQMICNYWRGQRMELT